jgi:hypothetical protein
MSESRSCAVRRSADDSGGDAGIWTNVGVFGSVIRHHAIFLPGQHAGSQEVPACVHHLPRAAELDGDPGVVQKIAIREFRIENILVAARDQRRARFEPRLQRQRGEDDVHLRGSSDTAFEDLGGIAVSPAHQAE